MKKRMQPFTPKKTLVFFIVFASLIAGLLDYKMGSRVDYWLHDEAVVYQKRQEWKYSGVVVLDNNVDRRVTRTQSLPLFAKAVDRLVAQGAKGVFLDARLSKEIEGRMPYAVCVEKDGSARWSVPGCHVTSKNACEVDFSEASYAPLKMNTAAMARFKIAPYLDTQEEEGANFVLYGENAFTATPEDGFVANDRLAITSDHIARWIDMSEDHAVFKLARLLAPDKVADLYAKNNDLDKVCNEGIRCRRVRLSEPLHKDKGFMPNNDAEYDVLYDLKDAPNRKRLMLPLSKVASCDETEGHQFAALLKNKLVILQMAAPGEGTDMLVSPMTTTLFGSRSLTQGSQYIVDELETVLNQDYPKAPPQTLRIVLFICVATLTVLVGTYFSQLLLWLTGLIIFAVLVTLCFFYSYTQLWPVTAVMTAYFSGAMQVVAIHLIAGVRQGKLLSQYLPKQVIELLMPLKNIESFRHRHCQVVVLMSDLAGYTTVTGLLKEPEHVMNLMNDYLGETSIVLQDKYNGILEAYVGDMVCYYWEYEPGHEKAAFEKALFGALELAHLQKTFFSSVANRYKGVLTPQIVEKISSIINAGIGVTAGDVVKGNLGPKAGVKKFAILGDPLNLAARIESLTRLFNTEIIIAGNFTQTTAIEDNLAVRRLGAIYVKGRVEPAVLYALGAKDDPRFAPDAVTAWEKWLTQIEARLEETAPCPEIYQKDRDTLIEWRNKGILDENGIWHLHEK